MRLLDGIGQGFIAIFGEAQHLARRTFASAARASLSQLTIAAIAIFLLSRAGLAAATEPIDTVATVPDVCGARPGQPFRSMAELRSVMESLGYRVIRISVDAGCYSVRVVNRGGKPFEVRFAGADLRTLSR